MKREDLTDELFCERCRYLGKPKEFKKVPYYEIVICPSCGGEDIVVASSIEWCDSCQQWPQEKGSNICTSCRIKSDEECRIAQQRLLKGLIFDLNFVIGGEEKWQNKKSQ